MLNYLHTKKTDKSRPDFLETAKKVADYVIAHIPESGLMPVDFKQPPEPAWEDSTASAIASCGLLELYRETADERYYQAALLLLKTLDEKRCDYSEANDCFLSHCSEAYHSNGHHINMVYADYFYIEAIFKLKGWDAFLW
jgi:unsaturated chondroitin disaccharide hydrolase